MIAALITLLTIGLGCGNPTLAPSPLLEIERDDARLSLVGGVLYLDGFRFTGRVWEWHGNTALESVTPYQNGRREGTAVSFFPNGQLRWERSYAAGREDGLHQGWFEDGRVHFRYPYVDGVLEGNALEWFPDGVLYRDFQYRAGREEGSQRMWHEDGTARANYVIRDGRRYGLMGAKGCVGDEGGDPAALADLLGHEEVGE